MPAESIPRWSGSRKLEAADCNCDWCEATVPIPEGDLCAVCIHCGMVIFRGRVAAEKDNGMAAAAMERRRDSLPASAV